MSQTIVVGYDASTSGNRALEFALNEAKSKGANVLIAHVLEWSPYSFLTPEELEERHKRRGEELARAEQAVLGPVVEKAKAIGVSADTELRYGHIAEVDPNYKLRTAPGEVEDELNFQISQPGIFRRGPDFGFTVLTYSRLFYDKGAAEYGVLLGAKDIKVKCIIKQEHIWRLQVQP